MTYIRSDEYLQFAEEPGVEVNINHADCPAGEDTRRRLGVQTTEDGLRVVAHCFNCGLSGSTRVNNGVRHLDELRAKKRRVEMKTKSYTVALPETTPISTWPSEAAAWFNQYGVPVTEMPGCGYSEEYGRVVLPIRSPYSNDTLNGFQLRRIFDSDEGPKYLTKRRWDTKHLWSIERGGNRRVAVVEDLLSAVKIRLAGTADAICLFGTAIPSDALGHVINNYDEAIVWLDNDAPNIAATRRGIKARLVMFLGENAKEIRYFNDPKRHSLETINEVLDVAE